MATNRMRWISGVFIVLSVIGYGEPGTGASVAPVDNIMIRANNIILGDMSNVALLGREEVKRVTYRLQDNESPQFAVETVFNYDKNGALADEVQQIRRDGKLTPFYTIERSKNGWFRQYIAVKDSEGAGFNYAADKAGKIAEIYYGDSENKCSELRYDEKGNIIEVTLESPLESQHSFYHYDQQNRLTLFESVMTSKGTADTAGMTMVSEFSYGQDGKMNRVAHKQIFSQNGRPEKREVLTVITPRRFDQRGNWLEANIKAYVNGEDRGDNSKAYYEIEYW